MAVWTRYVASLGSGRSVAFRRPARHRCYFSRPRPPPPPPPGLLHVEIVRSTVEPTGTMVPPCGCCTMTDPGSTQLLVSERLPTARPAALISLVAPCSSQLRTLGTWVVTVQVKLVLLDRPLQSVTDAVTVVPAP